MGPKFPFGTGCVSVCVSEPCKAEAPRVSAHLCCDDDHSNAGGRGSRIPLQRSALRLLHSDYGPAHAQTQEEVQHLNLGSDVKN